MSTRDAWVPPTASSSDPTTTSLTTTNASQSAAGANQAYQPPTSSYQSAFETVGAGGGGGAGPVVNYRCGECNAQVPLSAADAVRCKECGHRVLYKERTKRMVQFEAR